MECSICLIDVEQIDKLITTCGHIFHTSCFFNYIFSVVNNGSSNLLCPICRHELVMDQTNTQNIQSPNQSIVEVIQDDQYIPMSNPIKCTPNTHIVIAFGILSILSISLVLLTREIT